MLIPEQICKKYMAVYPDAEKQSDTLRSAKTSGDMTWPDWCWLPVRAAHTIVLNEIQKHPDVSMMQAAPDVGNLAAILNWRITKGVYRFDEDLLKSLWEVSLDRDIPVDVFFNLPEWCCYIDLEGFGPADAMELAGFFVYLEYDTNTGGREIRLTFARLSNSEKGPALSTLPFHIDDQKQIGDMLQGSFDFAAMHGPDHIRQQLESTPPLQKEAADLYSRYFSLVLYLCTADRDIIRTSKVRKTKKSKKKQKRALPVEYRVGSAIGGAIRRARGAAEKGTGEGSKKAPHIRKAHYHTYWTGKKGEKKKPVVKLIAPIPVNIGDEPVVPIVRRVK